MATLTFNDVETKIIQIRGEQVILDSDVATLYGVETKHVNQAVRNNPDKFPEGYILHLTMDEAIDSRSNFLTLNRGENIKYLPKAFTERGLYMLATILKSPIATQTTIVIVDTFAKLRELSRTMSEITTITDKESQNALMQKSGNIIADLLGNNLNVTDSETSFELNFALLKVKHSVKRKKDK